MRFGVCLGFSNSLLLERKDDLPVLLHVHDRPVFGFGFFKAFFQFAQGETS
jgi:hypothetical protein